MTNPAEVRIGTSGYVYRYWREGVFYPHKLPAREELALERADRLGLHPDRITTASFTYLPMHRGQEPEGGFTDEELVSWAAQIHALRTAGKEVYVYFNNDWGGFAIRDAVKVRELLGIQR
ncbi:MAG TPA: DUF72 domain-containing protein [Gemmatimonadales bacterium]|nr:DUF72 domain-containing protein [Gemmatimonadales bacterium]